MRSSPTQRVLEIMGHVMGNPNQRCVTIVYIVDTMLHGAEVGAQAVTVIGDYLRFDTDPVIRDLV